MLQVNDILNAIKQHGVLSVILVGMFVYFQSQINDLTEKYDGCMTERINDAYRMPRMTYNWNHEKESPKIPKQYAVIPNRVTIKKRIL